MAKDQHGFLETKTFFAELKIDEADSTETKGIFKGHANTWGKDLVNDIVEPGSFKKTIRETGKKRALYFMHNKFQLAELLGGATDLREDDTGLYTKGVLMMQYEEARKAFDLIKEGIIDRMSIGFKVIKAWFEEVNNEFIRHITEMKLSEISLVPVGMAANENALITDFKHDDIFDFIMSNKNDLQLRNKIFSIYGINPETITTQEPGETTAKNTQPGETTQEPTKFLAGVYDLINLRR